MKNNKEDKSNKQLKSETLKKLADYANNYKAVILVSYDKLPNEQLNRMRDQLYEADNKAVFIKNSLAALCFKDAGMDSSLHSSNMLIFGDDIFALIKSAGDFTKSLKFYPDTKLNISCGLLEKGLVDADKIQILKTIPSVQALYMNLINTLMYPIHQLARVLDMHSNPEGSEDAEAVTEANKEAIAIEAPLETMETPVENTETPTPAAEPTEAV